MVDQVSGCDACGTHVSEVFPAAAQVSGCDAASSHFRRICATRLEFAAICGEHVMLWPRRMLTPQFTGIVMEAAAVTPVDSVALELAYIGASTDSTVTTDRPTDVAEPTATVAAIGITTIRLAVDDAVIATAADTIDTMAADVEADDIDDMLHAAEDVLNAEALTLDAAATDTEMSIAVTKITPSSPIGEAARGEKPSIANPYGLVGQTTLYGKPDCSVTSRKA